MVGPGAADQAATDHDSAGQRQPERHHPPATLGAPAQLAVLVPPGMGALDDPAVAGLDRGWQPAGGDLADHAALGQPLATRLVVVAGVQVHTGWAGSGPTTFRASRVAASSHRRAGWPGPAGWPAGCRPPRPRPS